MGACHPRLVGISRRRGMHDGIDAAHVRYNAWQFRQILGRGNEVYLPESGTDRLMVVYTGTGK
mgnify:CR=1 FL=1